jgi:hypothetical protein
MLSVFLIVKNTYKAFDGFGQAKFAYGGSILGSSQYTLLLQLPLKTMLDLKVVKINSKISISLHESNFVTHSIALHLATADSDLQSYKD